jgi:hypothetical protein
MRICDIAAVMACVADRRWDYLRKHAAPLLRTALTLLHLYLSGADCSHWAAQHGRHQGVTVHTCTMQQAQWGVAGTRYPRSINHMRTTCPINAIT